MGLANQFLLQFGDQNVSGYISNMLDMYNYFFSNFLKSYKMSVAKAKVTQNRHVCDHSERKLQAMFYAYPIQLWVRYRNIEIAVNSLCDYSDPKRVLL